VSSTGVEQWKAPIEVKFEIPYFTVSGIQVRRLSYAHEPTSLLVYVSDVDGRPCVYVWVGVWRGGG
jgi:hypothetical protein